MPPKAQAAHQQAIWLADALPRLLAGEPVRPFAYRERGDLVSLGRHRAVGRLIGWLPRHAIRLQGLVGRLAYSAVQRAHLVVLHGLPRAMATLAGAWLAGRSGPRVKLH